MGISENQSRQRGGFGRLSYSGTRPWPEVPVGNHEHDSAAVVIIGGGIAGMNMAINLLTNRKVKSFIIIEKGGGFGGTWRDNKFPGCCCDVWSHLYCYSFEQNSDWSRAYPGQEEILVSLMTRESAIYSS
jgi:cation diffusion facilitator CzcD-associated flavoprotein CzcO